MTQKTDDEKFMDSLFMLGAGDAWFVCDFDGFSNMQDAPHGVHWCRSEISKEGHYLRLPQCSSIKPVQSCRYIPELHVDQPKCYACGVLYFAQMLKETDA